MEKNDGGMGIRDKVFVRVVVLDSAAESFSFPRSSLPSTLRSSGLG